MRCECQNTAPKLASLTVSQEVAEYQAECHAVRGIASEIKEIIDTAHRQCIEQENALDVIPTSLIEPILKLQTYVRIVEAFEQYLIDLSDASIEPTKPWTSV